MPEDIHVPIQSDVDIITARQQGRALAARIGFSSTDITLIATAISELARNIVLYASRGEIVLRVAENAGAPGIMIIGRDEGPGIRHVRDAMRDGYSTSGGLGLGLPGVKRLMDEFEIDSEIGRGTTVSIKKWRR
jgi:serine/threonine-protein kinase RsbT